MLSSIRITKDLLHELLIYEANIGKIYWKHRDRKYFSSEKDYKSWNSRFSGKEATTTNKVSGYLNTTIFNKKYYTHRIIWFYLYGEWPEFIDHINGDRVDNRPENLRSVCKRDNSKNRKICTRNTSGVMGVSWHKKTKRWRAFIKIFDKVVTLGSSENMQEMIKLRKNAEVMYGYHLNHGRVTINGL
jgi:hypothetical protein